MTTIAADLSFRPASPRARASGSASASASGASINADNRSGSDIGSSSGTSNRSDAGLSPLMLVLPGGSYREHASHEGEAVADWLAGIGIHALVVRYPVDPNRHPAGLRRVQEVLAGVRSGALELVDAAGEPAAIDRSRIGVVGFSAGGHVAALLSTGADADGPHGDDRPDLAVLAYPVISMTHEPHSESQASLLGDKNTLDNRRALSAEYLVDAGTPPTFLWHTADDGGVPVSHSLRYASALAVHNIPFDLHVFERGDHGKGLGVGYGPLEAWTALCEAWLGQHGWIGVTPD
ncbi:MAG: putative lipase/esterase [Glaciihabitans sp.]|nr:putative lipase/esterase [Glaciihabitans sp.]